jgi:outer membrane protein assembly factor BamB
LKWPTSDAWKGAVKGPLSLQGSSLLVPFEGGAVLVDPTTARTEKAGAAPAAKDEAGVRIHGLQFRIADGELRCTTEDDKTVLWRATPETPVTGVPTVAGDRVFITTAGKDKAKAFIEGRKLVDGTLAWRRELDDVPLSPVVAAGDWCAVATADEKIAVFGASGGKLREPLPVGGKPVAPALCGDVVIVAGENRIAAHDLSSSEWIWNYKDQDNIGTVSGQPIVLGETIWVGTTKRGLVAIGIPQVQAKK